MIRNISVVVLLALFGILLAIACTNSLGDSDDSLVANIKNNQPNLEYCCKYQDSCSFADPSTYSYEKCEESKTNKFKEKCQAVTRRDCWPIIQAAFKASMDALFNKCEKATTLERQSNVGGLFCNCVGRNYFGNMNITGVFCNLYSKCCD